MILLTCVLAVAGLRKRPIAVPVVSGSVTRDVERGARVPVLVAKNDGCEEGSLAWREAYAAR